MQCIKCVRDGYNALALGHVVIRNGNGNGNGLGIPVVKLAGSNASVTSELLDVGVRVKLLEGKLVSSTEYVMEVLSPSFTVSLEGVTLVSARSLSFMFTVNDSGLE